jgi:hypothetical protein
VVCNGLVVCNVNGNLNKSENSQDYAQKPQRNCMFMNSASEIKSWCDGKECGERGEMCGRKRGVRRERADRIGVPLESLWSRGQQTDYRGN